MLRLWGALVRGANATGGFLDRAVWFVILFGPVATGEWQWTLVAIALFATWQVLAKMGMIAMRGAIRRASEGT